RRLSGDRTPRRRGLPARRRERARRRSASGSPVVLLFPSSPSLLDLPVRWRSLRGAAANSCVHSDTYAPFRRKRAHARPWNRQKLAKLGRWRGLQEVLDEYDLRTVICDLHIYDRTAIRKDGKSSALLP